MVESHKEKILETKDPNLLIQEILFIVDKNAQHFEGAMIRF